MAGTSTAGLNSIMLGRLRMSVDQAIDNFKDFSFAVLGQPQTLLDMANNRHFSPVKTRNAFQNIIMSSNNFAHQYVSEREDTAQNEAFRENGGRRTRTMTVSYNGSTNREHIWRSYDGLHSKASESRSATIWEVALATSATPSFFSPMKANDATYWDGIVAENSPSYLALLEITEFHSKSPAVFVNLRSRPAMKAETKRRLEILARTLSWAHYPPKPLKQRISDINKLLQYFTTDSTTESESNQFRELAKSKGALTAYTLTTEGVLPRPWPIVLRSGSEKVKEALQQTAATTKHYLQQDEVRVVINRIAEEAVRIRRARAHANIEQWEDFVQ
ncbi:hypothetical protein H9Q72_008959 [Fusarium xylarioides]|uniref:PNPLA domain-containing protein n=1 Tax=Fusarium xylarioides TaxID=221167 RepID=A0A9P7HMF4_9HYPO|nr:hypothetical protein H9Q72_008959 [Fusarium xylarioides]